MKVFAALLSILTSSISFAGGIHCKQCPAESNICTPRPDCAEGTSNASAHAVDKIICVNRGNINGSYSLDITGYEKVLDGTVKSFTKILNFKWFRSYEESVTNVICKAPNSYIDGPNALLVCKTENYGPNAMVTLIYEHQAKLFMSVRGPNQPLVDGIYCQRSNF